MTIENGCTVVRGGWSTIKSFLLEVSSLVLTDEKNLGRSRHTILGEWEYAEKIMEDGDT